MALLDDLDRIDREREETERIAPSMEKAPAASGSLVSDLEGMEADITKRETQSYLENRGFLAGLASDVAGGLLDSTRMGFQAVRALTPQTGPEPEPGSLRERLTTGIENIERFKEEHPFFQETPGQTGVSRAVHGGVRSFAQSLGAGIPAALAGGAAGSALGPAGTAVGGVLGYALGGAAQFGLAQYEDVMERGIKQKMSEGMTFEDAKAAVEPAAMREAAYEGGFEGASDILSGLTMGAGKVVSSVGKEALKTAIKDLTKVGFKEFAKRAAGVAGIETGSEMLTAGAQAEEEKVIGLGTSDFWSAAKDAFGPAFVASTLFAGLGHANVRAAQRDLVRSLEDPSVDPKRRAAAVDEIGKTLDAYDPGIAKVWMQNANAAIEDNQSISANNRLVDLQRRIANLEKIEEGAWTETQRRNWQSLAGERDRILALPPGQGFEMREPEDVYAPYSPQYAEQIRAGKERALPPGREFTLSGDVNQQIADFDNRIANLTQYATSVAGQVSRTSSEERRSRLVEKLNELNAQIAVNREARDSLIPRQEELPVEPAGQPAMESARVFEREAGRVQSPAGAEMLRRRLAREEREAASPVTEALNQAADDLRRDEELHGSIVPPGTFAGPAAQEPVLEGGERPLTVGPVETVEPVAPVAGIPAERMPEQPAVAEEPAGPPTVEPEAVKVERPAPEGEATVKEQKIPSEVPGKKNAGVPAFRIEHDDEGNVRGIITDAKGNEHSSIWYEAKEQKSAEVLRERAFKTAVFEAKRRYGTATSSEQADQYRQKQTESIRDLAPAFRPEGRPEIIAEADFEGTKYQALILPQILESGAVVYRVFMQNADGSALEQDYPSHQSGRYDETAKQFGERIADDARYVVHDPVVKNAINEKKAVLEKQAYERKAQEEQARKESAARAERLKANEKIMKGVKFKTVTFLASLAYSPSGWDKTEVKGKAVGDFAYHKPIGYYDPKRDAPYVISHIPSGSVTVSDLAGNQSMAREITYRLSLIKAKWNGKGKPSKTFLDAARKAVQGFMDENLIESIEEKPLPALKETTRPGAVSEEKAAGAPPKIEDVGEKIGGARKDRWAERGLDLSDLDTMTEGEAATVVNKESVWPKADYGKMIDEGAEPNAVAAIKIIRDRIAKTPRKNTPEGRRNYVEMMGIVRDVLSSAKTMEDVSKAHNIIFEQAGWPAGIRYAVDPAVREKVFSIYRGRKDPLSLGWDEKRRISKMIEGGFPAKKEGGIRSAEDEGKIPERPHLDIVERTGEDIRGNQDITGDDLLKDFGFRGIEHGNWAAQDERQKSLNLAYEALHDLANILGIPPRAVSLNGTLGLAFGSRGGGKFAAHYEPGKLVINLTKLRGAGTLSHEWAHALDHYLGESGREMAYKTAPVYASGGRIKPGRYTEQADERFVKGESGQLEKIMQHRLSDLRPETASAFDGVMNAIFQRNKTKAESIRDLELAIERGDSSIQNQKNRIADAQKRIETGVSDTEKTYASKFISESKKWIASAEERLENQKKRLETMRSSDEGMHGTTKTSFLANAQKLVGKSTTGYWTRPTEMFARAFEAYAFDKIGDKGNVSQYLVQGVEETRYAGGKGYRGNPYPVGEERKTINAAFDKLFSVLQTRETEKGVALFSLKEATRPGAMSSSEISFALSPVLQRWAKNAAAPRIEIANRFENLPREVQAMLGAQKHLLQGMYSPRNRTVILLAENITSPIEAEEVLLHEAVGHHGMRVILGDRFTPYLKEVVSLYGKKGLRDIADLYGFDLETEKGRLSAADEKIARMAESGERPGFIRRLIAEIREALRDMGFTVKLSDNDIKAMIAHAGKLMETEFDMPDKVQRAFPLAVSEPKFSLKSAARKELVSTFKAVDRHVRERTETGFLGRLFITPEHWKHPVGKRIFDAAQGKQEDRHQILNNVLKVPELVDRIKPFMFRGKNWLISQKGYDYYDQSQAPKEYRDFGYHLDYMDRNNLKWDTPQKDAAGKAVEPYRNRLVREKKVSREVIEAIDETRKMLDAALELQRADIRELLDHYEQAGKPVPVVGTQKTPDGRTEQVTLKDLYNQMGFLKGSYSPRIREAGDWYVTSVKGGERYRFHQGSARAAYKFAERLRREGHANVSEPQRIERLPESVYQDISIPDIQAAVDRAVKGANLEPEMEAKLRQSVLESASDLLKERGFRAHKISRSEGPVIKGYITDPLTRNLMYAQQTAGGIAKSKAASKMFAALMGEWHSFERDGKNWIRKDDAGNVIETVPMSAEELKADKQAKTVHVGGIDPKKEPERYTVYTEYISEMLRNPDASDRFIALGKSLISFKYLGLSPRSALANVTALATTVPPALHEYAMGGKGSMLAIGNELTRACRDFGRVMVGKKLANAMEQQFMDDVQGSSDLEQYTREAMANLAGAYGKSWQAAMNKSMWMFGKSEAWIRGSTMLAGYRLARKRGSSHEQAMKAAKEASNRAHGIYSEASQPLWTMGSNPAAKIGKMGMTYLKFAHNYLQTMYDLGMRKRNAKAFTFALLSPAVLAGSSATIAAPIAIALGGAMLKALGDDRDPEKFVFDTIRRNVGAEAERFARFGLLGMAGIDISGSLAIGLEPPKTLMDLTGPFGGVAQDIARAGHYLMTGQPGKAAERALPSFAGNLLRAARELSGATTSSGARVWDEDGKPYIPTVTETAERVMGFRSERRATVEARQREAKRESANYADARRNIYERYRAYVASKEEDAETFREIMDAVANYNRRVQGAGLQRIIPMITAQALRNQLTRMERPTTRQAAIIESFKEE